MRSLPLEFRPLAEADLPLLCTWLNRPHLADWKCGDGSLDAVRSAYSPGVEAGMVRRYLACLGSEPIGYIQWYVAVDRGDGWWSGNTDPSVRGLDQFIADPGRLDQGLGTAMATRFAALLLQDPAVSRLQVDPRPDNLRAIRCYEKAGFRPRGLVNTPDGAALLMVLERPRAG